MDSEKVLTEVKELCLKDEGGELLVDRVSFALRPGDTLGLVGESGSGKTLTLRAVLGLLPPDVHVFSGEIRTEGNLAMVFQNPLKALDPLCPVFKQVTEVVRVRQGLGKKEAREYARALFERLALPAELYRRDRRPGELSGGQCQRVLIAMALACRPDVLLCDEPTTALDVTVQKQTLDLIRELQREMGFAILFVTHNLAVASQLCSRLIVMQHGRILEEGCAQQILKAPKEDYTRTLVRSVLPIPKREEE